MALMEIKIYPEKVLREKARPIEKIDDEIRKLASDMAQTMYAAPGIGLAAPQVGRSVRLIVCDIQSGNGQGQLFTLINPKVVETGGEFTTEEGCLSLPEVREEVTRPASVTVKALNLDGEEVTIQANDLLAVCMQHEIDHLNGILFIDHLSRLKRELIKRKLKKAKAQR